MIGLKINIKFTRHRIRVLKRRMKKYREMVEQIRDWSIKDRQLFSTLKIKLSELESEYYEKQYKEIYPELEVKENSKK